MRNNETGEFELIIGNRQLLSGFFIVVLLFAVAFAMGYVVGQNSPRSAKLAAEAASVTPSNGTDAQRPAPVAAASNPQPSAPTPEGTQAPPSEGAAPPPTPDAAKPAEPATANPSAQAAPAPAANAAKTYPEPPAAAAGAYWQVIAVSQTDVDLFYNTLKDKGFPTYVQPGTKGLMRVLVGPYQDRDQMGKVKDEIEKLGFKPIRH
jgi:cell division septation protein DedD